MTRKRSTKNLWQIRFYILVIKTIDLIGVVYTKFYNYWEGKK